MPRRSTPPVYTEPWAKSRVTNHHDLLPGLKGTSTHARRFRDLVNAFISDMGGADQCSDIKIALLRRLAAVTVQAELVEAKMVNGEQIDIASLCTLASTSVRIASRTGVNRIPRELLTPDPLAYARDLSIDGAAL